MSRFWLFVESLFEEHKLVRRSLVVWALWMITTIIFKFESLMVELNTATVSGVATIIGILATVTGFYIKSRELDK